MADNSLFAPGFKGLASLDLLPTNARIFDLKNVGAIFQDNSRAYFPRPSTGGGRSAFAAQSSGDIVGPVVFGPPIPDKRLQQANQAIGLPAPPSTMSQTTLSFRSAGTPTTYGGRS